MERQRNPGLLETVLSADTPHRFFNTFATSKKIFRGFIHPLCGTLILPPSLPPRGRCLDRLGRVGRERRPRRSGPDGASGGLSSCQGPA